MGIYIAEYYRMGLYTVEDLDLFVSVNMLTVEERTEILSTPQ